MKISELPEKTNLGGLRVKTHNGQIGIWRSQWSYTKGTAGVWLSRENSNEIIPINLNKLEEALEWEITDEPINI